MIGASFVSLGLPPKRPQEPFPAYDDDIIRKIEEAICVAWNHLVKSSALDLKTAAEKEITAALQECIIDVLNCGCVEGFVPEIFQQPTRDASVRDYSGKYLEKKPDLAFFVMSAQPLSANKGLFFECKPIGNVATYLGDNGLGRFCDGRYAWAMPHAGMIGYVQRKTAPLSAKEAIEGNAAAGTLTVQSHYGDKAASYHPIWVSIHARNFILQNGAPPGSITIRHIWLNA